MSCTENKALSNAISVKFVKFGGVVRVNHLDRRSWASVTFSGARHHLRITLEGVGAAGAGADFLEELADMDLSVPGHIVADVVLLAEGRSDDGRYASLELEALTIEDA
jgi:hypothetical protein